MINPLPVSPIQEYRPIRFK